MSLTHTVTVRGKAVTLRELTVKEVRDWALKAEQGLIPVDPVAHLALPDCSLQDLELMGAVLTDLEEATPSELVEAVDAAKKLNPHFFRLRAAMTGAALVMTQQARQMLSSEPAPSS